MNNDNPAEDQSRRSFVKRAAYVAPVIMTLDAMPAFASYRVARGAAGTTELATESIHSRQEIRRSMMAQARTWQPRQQKLTHAGAPHDVTDDGRKTALHDHRRSRSRERASTSIALCSCGRTFVIHCHDHETAALVRTAFGGLLASSPPAHIGGPRSTTISNADGIGRFRVVDSGGAEATFDDSRLSPLPSR